jgi:hypothetical protein
MCLNKGCLFIHRGTVAPRKPGDVPTIGPNNTKKWLKANVATGVYSDDTPIGYTDPILCCECDHPVYADPQSIAMYVDWKSGGKDPDKEPRSMGLSIAVKEIECQVPATYGLLADLGFYGSGPMAAMRSAESKAKIVDRSAEWDYRRETCKQAYSRARTSDRIRTVLGGVARGGPLRSWTVIDRMDIFVLMCNGRTR